MSSGVPHEKEECCQEFHYCAEGRHAYGPLLLGVLCGSHKPCFLASVEWYDLGHNYLSLLLLLAWGQLEKWGLTLGVI